MEEIHSGLQDAVADDGVVGVARDEENADAGMFRGDVLRDGGDDGHAHGQEDAEYLSRLRDMTDKPVIQAFRIRTTEDAKRAEKSAADYILLDAGAGDGKTFEWELAESVERPYFLAGGLTPENAGEAAERLHPFALDVSSGIETDGWKDPAKMRAFVNHVRRKER